MDTSVGLKSFEEKVDPGCMYKAGLLVESGGVTVVIRQTHGLAPFWAQMSQSLKIIPFGSSVHIML